MPKVYFGHDESSVVPYGTTVDIPSSMIDYEYDSVFARAADFIESALKAKGMVIKSRYDYHDIFESQNNWLIYWHPMD